MKFYEVYGKITDGTATAAERKQFLDVVDKMRTTQDGQGAYAAYAKDPKFLQAIETATNEASGAGLSREAIDLAKKNYGDRQPFRDYSTNALGAAGIPNLDGPYNADQEYQNFQPITTNYQTDPRLSTALDKVTNGPNRMELVNQYLADMDAKYAPQRAHDYQVVGQNASRLGRLGSGQVTTDLGNLESDYELNRLLAGNDAIRNATEADVGDRLNAYQAVGTYDNNMYGRAQNQTNERRGERDVKMGLGREGLANRMDLQNRRFGQAVTSAGLGYGNDPSGAVATGANFQNSNFWRGKELQQQQDAQAQQDADSWKDTVGMAAYFVPVAGQAKAAYDVYSKTRQPKGKSTSGYGYSTGSNYG